MVKGVNYVLEIPVNYLNISPKFFEFIVNPETSIYPLESINIAPKYLEIFEVISPSLLVAVDSQNIRVKGVNYVPEIPVNQINVAPKLFEFSVAPETSIYQLEAIKIAPKFFDILDVIPLSPIIDCSSVNVAPKSFNSVLVYDTQSYSVAVKSEDILGVLPSTPIIPTEQKSVKVKPLDIVQIIPLGMTLSASSLNVSPKSFKAVVERDTTALNVYPKTHQITQII